MLQDQFRNRYPAVKLELTGELPLNFDLRKASRDDVQKGESLVLPATLALLLLAFASVVAALIPLAIGQLAISMALGVRALGLRWHLSILVQNGGDAALGLSLGIDVFLLMVGRFRFIRRTRTLGSVGNSRPSSRPHSAVASTVAIGFAALLTVPISEIRSIGRERWQLARQYSASAGSRIDACVIPFVKRLNPNSSRHARTDGNAGGRAITSHPWTALVLAGVPLLLLVSQAPARLDTRLPRGDWLPSSAESVQGLPFTRKK